MKSISILAVALLTFIGLPLPAEADLGPAEVTEKNKSHCQIPMMLGALRNTQTARYQLAQTELL